LRESLLFAPARASGIFIVAKNGFADD